MAVDMDQGNYFYLFLGNLPCRKIVSENIDSAYEQSLEQFDLKDIEILSKTNNSIFFNATVNNVRCRCSVANKSVVDEDEIDLSY